MPKKCMKQARAIALNFKSGVQAEQAACLMQDVQGSANRFAATLADILTAM